MSHNEWEAISETVFLLNSTRKGDFSMVRTELFHAMIVHFPIALLLFSCLFFFLSRFGADEARMKICIWSLVLGAVGGCVAIGTGYLAEADAVHNAPALDILQIHEPLGIAVVSVAAILIVIGLVMRWRFTAAVRAFYALLFVILAGLIGLTGHFGAKMVYEKGMAVSKTPLCAKMNAPVVQGDAPKEK